MSKTKTPKVKDDPNTRYVVYNVTQDRFITKDSWNDEPSFSSRSDVDYFVKNDLENSDIEFDDGLMIYALVPVAIVSLKPQIDEYTYTP